MKIAIRPFILLLCSLSLMAVTSMAQDFRATITGRVTDASKAALPNAQVRVKNIGTNEITTMTTDSEGNYKVPFLRPGTYTVSVEVNGFKKSVREEVELVISQVATIDFSLETGNISEQVTVLGEAPLIESATADRGGVIDRQRVIELPLNARNPFMLGMLTAGVNFNGASIWQRPFDNGAIAEWTINGSQSRGNEFLLDGAPNNSQAGGNNIAYVPPVDSVQDFKIMTNTYDAQYGKTTGGIINVNLKSGTNSVHGSIYEFMRRQWLDATDFRLKANGAPKAQHYLDQYGGQIEGPVYIPKIYNGRDKTFFMFNYEGYREGVPQPLTLSVPSPEFLNGDFSKLVDSAGKVVQLYDPRTLHNNPAFDQTKAEGENNLREIRYEFKCDAAGNPIGGQPDGIGVPCNRIPANRINPIARKILGFYRQPNRFDPTAGYARRNLFVSPNLATDTFFNYVAKIDQQFNERHRMYVRYAKNDRTEDRNVNGITDAPGQDGQHPLKRINDAFVVDHLATFSPNFILNIRASLARFVEGSRGDANIGFDQTTLGFPASLISQLPNTRAFGRYEFGDYTSLGRYTGFNYTNTLSIHPNLTWVRGSQTWRAGVDMRWTQYNTTNEGNPFRLTSGRGFTQRSWRFGNAQSGDSIASFLMGYVSGGNIDNNLFPNTLGNYYAPWFQNDWKVNHRLTLNLGVRWDINKAPMERYDRINHGFDPNVANPIDSLVNHLVQPVEPGKPSTDTVQLPKLRGGLLFANQNGLSRTPGNTDWNNIQPRIGFAYKIKEKLVMRGGWGLYYVNPNNDYLQFAGFSSSTPVVGSLDGGRTPEENLLNNPFPNGVVTPSGNSRGIQTFLGNGFNYFNPNFNIPVVHQYSFGFQYEMPWQSRIELSYVGNRTRQLQTTRPGNEPDLAIRKLCNPLEGGNPSYCDQRMVNPFKGIEAFRGSGLFEANDVTRWQLMRPYPQFGAFTEVGRNDGAIDYNSFQVTFDKRTRGGMNLNMTYTFSKQIEKWGWNDVQKGIMQRGLYFADRPHRFTTGMVYPLPFGEGKKLFNTGNRFLSKIISGWESNLIFQWQSGRPWDLPGNILWLNDDATNKNIKWKGTDQVWAFRTYPNKDNTKPPQVCIGQVNGSGAVELTTNSKDLVGCGVNNVDVLLNPAYAPRVTSFRHPSLRLYSPPIADLSFNKTTKITETKSLQFRVEMFNFTNTYAYRVQQFNGNTGDRNFGSVVPRTAGDTDVAYPRHIQLALKFRF